MTTRQRLLAARHRKRRATPMQRLRLADVAATGGGAAIEFPGLSLPEPEAGKRRWISGSIAALLHAGAVVVLLVLAAVAPEEEEEELIPVQLVRELETKSEEPAPAPKALAERRSVTFAPSAQAVAPQVVNPTVAAEASPAMAAERLEVDTAFSAVRPREISQAAVAVETVEAITSVAAAPTRLDLDTSAGPALRGPIESVAPVGPSVGPRVVAAGESGIGLAPVRVGDGSSVREGVSSTRDVLGSPDGPRLASVNTRVGEGYLRGTGGSGTGVGGDAVDCLERPEVGTYLENVKGRMYSRWALPPNVPSGAAVLLRFRLDAGGSAHDVEPVEVDDQRLAESAVAALRSASPFPPMSDRVRCLADAGVLLGRFSARLEP